MPSEPPRRGEPADDPANDPDARAGAAALIGLGANLPSPAGPPRDTLREALRLLAARGVGVAASSPWYATPAHPPGSGPEFVNGAARLVAPDGAAWSAEIWLDHLHAVEAALGRPDRRPVAAGAAAPTDPRRWRPRGVDLDLLALGAAVTPDRAAIADWMARSDEACRAAPPPPAPLVPHPRLHLRPFVLGPLVDIAPDWRHPLLGRTAAELWAALQPAARATLRRLEP